MFSAQNTYGHGCSVGVSSPKVVCSSFPLAGSNPRNPWFQFSFGFHPHPKSILSPVCERLIRVENGRVPTCHRPKNRPENKGIKPITNRHKPNHRLPQGDSSQKSPCKLSRYFTYPSPKSYLSHPLPAALLKEGRDAVTFLKPIQGYSSLFQSIQAFLAPPGGSHFFSRLACSAVISKRRRMAARKDHSVIPSKIRVYLCPSVFKLSKPASMQGFLTRWTATVSGTVSRTPD
jgi:hypothetical protein